MDADEAVRALALEWLQSIGEPATSVRSVSGYGTDWEGGTDEGFRSSFTVDITYATEAQDYNSMTVEGERMDSLWHFVLTRAVAERAQEARVPTALLHGPTSSEAVLSQRRASR